MDLALLSKLKSQLQKKIFLGGVATPQNTSKIYIKPVYLCRMNLFITVKRVHNALTDC